MEWLIFRLTIWLTTRRIENYHQWVGLYLRDRLDEFPYRDCDVSEGMWW